MTLDTSLKKKGLLIDDDPIMISLIGEILGTVMNIPILTASTWEESVDKAVVERPFIIILNLFISLRGSSLFPYMEAINSYILGEEPPVREVDRNRKDGFNLACSLKEISETASIPILGIGPMNIPYLRGMALKAGCNDYLGKPFGMTDFVNKVRGLTIHDPPVLTNGFYYKRQE